MKNLKETRKLIKIYKDIIDNAVDKDFVKPQNPAEARIMTVAESYLNSKTGFSSKDQCILCQGVVTWVDDRCVIDCTECVWSYSNVQFRNINFCVNSNYNDLISAKTLQELKKFLEVRIQMLEDQIKMHKV
jgi:hypothetical protein